VGRFLEVGSGTRRRPKRTGLPSSPGYAATRCRDKDAAFDKLRRGKGGNKRGLRDLGIQARVGRDKPPPLRTDLYLKIAAGFIPAQYQSRL
jgi:hypothetical protein